jgi:hypothetical protein
LKQEIVWENDKRNTQENAGSIPAVLKIVLANHLMQTHLSDPLPNQPIAWCYVLLADAPNFKRTDEMGKLKIS